MEKYYYFRDSKVFEMIFESIKEDQLPIQRKPSQIGKLKDNQDHLTLDEFDKISHEIIFSKRCREHFALLSQYPQSNICMDYLHQFWADISADQIQRELDYIKNYEVDIIKNKDAQFRNELKEHLECFSRMKSYYDKALLLI